MVNRRNVLSLLACAGVVASAGCQDAASRVRKSFSGSEHSGGALYERWLPATVAPGNHDGFGVSYVDLETVRNLEGSLSESTESAVRRLGPRRELMGALGIDVENVDAALSLSPGVTTVLTGSFESSSVAEELEAMDAEASYEYEGYEVFRAIDRGRPGAYSFAVDSSTILQTVTDSSLESESWIGVDEGDDETAVNDSNDESKPNDQPSIERLIETGTGDRDRRQDVDDDVATLLEHTESPTYLHLVTYSETPGTYPDESVGLAVGLSMTDDRTTARMRVLFEDETTATEDRMRETVSESGFSESFDDVTYSVSGRLGTAEASKPTAELDLGGSDDSGENRSPAAGIRIDRNDDSVTVTITTIERADEIRIQRNQEAVETLADPEVGDSVTVEASSGDTITVVGSYEGNEAVLTRYDV